MRRVGLAATAAYLPERWMDASEVAEASGIPEWVIREKFGLRGKHVAAPDEHAVSLAPKVGFERAGRLFALAKRERHRRAATGRGWRAWKTGYPRPWQR